MVLSLWLRPPFEKYGAGVVDKWLWESLQYDDSPHVHVTPYHASYDARCPELEDPAGEVG